MNIITDKTKAPAKLRYRVSNNSGSINKEFGKNQQAAYDFANEISYISRQCEIALQNISELGLTEAKNNEMNNIIAKYNGNEQ